MLKKILIMFFLSFSLLLSEDKGWDGFEDPGFGNFSFLTTSWGELDFFDSWQILSTFYFDVYYYNEVVVQDVVDYGDQVYDMIIEDFGWLYFSMPKRVSIYIYRNAAEYARKTDMSQWAGGHADLKQNAIYSYEQKNIFANVIVHELTHLVFDAYMGYPRCMAINWLHEGVAIYEEKKVLNKVWKLKYLKDLDKQGELISIRDLFKTHIGLQETSQKVGLWYFEVGTLIAYLRTLDKDGFRIFTQNLKNYNNIVEALKMTYPWGFKGIDDLEKGWKNWLYQKGDTI
ncbi:MAG: hypothetical protein GY817_00635 [bacterium]|nr:hypothetical protein [bacterium]